MPFRWIREASYGCVTLNKKCVILRAVARVPPLPVGIFVCLMWRRERENTFQNVTGTFLPTHFTHALIFPYFEPFNVHCVQYVYNSNWMCCKVHWLQAFVPSALSHQPVRSLTSTDRQSSECTLTIHDRPGRTSAGCTDLPTDHVVLTTFNPSEPNGLILNNSTFCPHSVFYVFCVDLRTNSDYFPIQYQLTGFYNLDRVYCAVRTEFTCNIY